MIEKDMQRQMISVGPAIMMGKPVIACTRIIVELILDKLAAGETIDQFLEARPRLKRKSAYTALAYAADILRANNVERNRDHLVNNDGRLELGSLD